MSHGDHLMLNGMANPSWRSTGYQYQSSKHRSCMHAWAACVSWACMACMAPVRCMVVMEEGILVQCDLMIWMVSTVCISLQHRFKACRSITQTYSMMVLVWEFGLAVNCNKCKSDLADAVVIARLPRETIQQRS